MPDRPRVSIGLPAYNSDEFIGASLESLLSQDFRNFELIICGDGGTCRQSAQVRQYCISFQSPG